MIFVRLASVGACRHILAVHNRLLSRNAMLSTIKTLITLLKAIRALKWQTASAKRRFFAIASFKGCKKENGRQARRASARNTTSASEESSRL